MQLLALIGASHCRIDDSANSENVENCERDLSYLAYYEIASEPIVGKSVHEFINSMSVSSPGVCRVRLFRTAHLPDPNRVSEELLGLGRVRFELGFRDIVRGTP